MNEKKTINNLKDFADFLGCEADIKVIEKHIADQQKNTMWADVRETSVRLIGVIKDGGIPEILGEEDSYYASKELLFPFEVNDYMELVKLVKDTVKKEEQKVANGKKAR